MESLTPIPSGKLCPLPKETLESQFVKFSTLRRSEPEKCRIMYDRGEALVELASSGKFSKLRSLLVSSDAGDILLYHSHKMFMESLSNGHLIISEYILTQGYPFRSARASIFD